MCLLSLSLLSDSLQPDGLQPPGFSVHGDSPGKNTGVGCYALLQGIFPTQGSNPGLPHCRQILYHLSHQGSPRILGVGSLSLLQRIFPTQELNWSLLHCRQILYQLSYQGSPEITINNMTFSPSYYLWIHLHFCVIRMVTFSSFFIQLYIINIFPSKEKFSNSFSSYGVLVHLTSIYWVDIILSVTLVAPEWYKHGTRPLWFKFI